VSEPESRSSPDENLAPTTGVRLAWWFGLYFLPQIPLIQLIGGFYLFPIGLFRVLVPQRYDPDMESLGWALIVVPYVIYVAHLVVSLSVRKKLTFQILMIILIILAVLNLSGCEEIVQGLHNIN
jgi:signal transduction histidine kinase